MDIVRRKLLLVTIGTSRVNSYCSESMRPKAKWAIDSETMRVRGIYCFSKIQLVSHKNIETKQL